MKKLIVIATCFLLLSSKCKKKEAQDYLPGSWGILTYKENNIDKTSDFNIAFQGFKLTFDAKGNYTEYYNSPTTGEKTITGTWTLENNNLKLVLVDNDPNSANKLRTFNVVDGISATVLDIVEDNKEYDLRKL
jgi:hypothetical protein